MRRRRRHNTWIGLAAPALSLALLAAVVVIGGFDSARSPRRDAYIQRVGEAIDTIPYRVGDWWGTQEEATPAAVKLLKPTRIVQRRYTTTSGDESFGLLFVHCGDVRDMQGHYPPICYKGHGWTLVKAEPRTVEFGGRKVTLERYRFERGADGLNRPLVIWNMFVLPQHERSFAQDMRALDAAARSTRQSGLGAGQIQFIFGDDLSEQRQRQIVEQFLGALGPTLETITEGIGT